ncbi:sigma-70 family RNA polymerase sigma factor [Paenibacillus dendritiformis]|uniref:sigma-70 family RNA polymerase sigma factor n=1 Tax=Paenibacillus dendritiformis TaxID=130049 RepID=UPI00105A5AF4|nr:sigma-70 family RNA polymerase sigma factor [Paenibacillus dendritiformis]TDL48511.1 sigma-70 family RNA polymerase sigma factor [Paenibacillus dendritiformis]
MLQWIEAAKRGEQSACEYIVRQFTGMALTVAYERLCDVHLAEDAVQEAFAEAFMNLPKLQQQEAFPGWFKVILERQCSRMLRRKRHPIVPIHEWGQIAGDQASVAAVVERREMQASLRISVAGLSPQLRLAVQLYYFQGYSIPEISICLGVSVSTLKKRLFDARRMLKKSLHVADFISVFHDLYEGGTGMLHIVNGDSVAEKLKKGGIQGEILVWREVYPHGPVFRHMDADQNRRQRAQYLEQTLGIPHNEYIQTCKNQEEILQNFGKYKEIVLWFEHDLFDQTMLCYLLHWLYYHPLGDTQLNLLCIGSYPGLELFRGLGQLSAEQLQTLSGTWQPIGQEELALGKKVWEAYTSAEWSEHLQLLKEDTSSLPFVRDAFEAHLARIPSDRNGIGIIEQVTLEAVSEGIHHPYELFKQVGDRLHVLGMGDLEYWYRLKKMSEEPSPLLQIEGLTAFPDYHDSVPSFRQCVVRLTDLGQQVLTGEANWEDMIGADEWYGGFHRLT